MDKKLLFVFNPRAGKAKIRPNLSDIINEFVKNGYWVTAYTTQGVADAKRVVKEQAKQYDMVVCSGGDGTLNEVVGGLVESGADIPVGYIPAGSTNDYGTSLGISKNMLQAAQTAMQGTDFLSDLGVMNGQNFVYVAAFGAFTEVTYQTGQQFKNIMGHTAYLINGVKSLGAIKDYRLKIEMDGEVLEDEFILGMITNTVSVGGFRNITGQDVVLDDGLFEVILIRKLANPLEFPAVIADIMLKSYNSKCIYRYKANRIVIESEVDIPWTLDGEFGGEHSKVEIHNVMQAFRIRIDEQRMQEFLEKGSFEGNLEEEEEEMYPEGLVDEKGQGAAD